jgi:hypothetical protein
MANLSKPFDSILLLVRKSFNKNAANIAAQQAAPYDSRVRERGANREF